MHYLRFSNTLSTLFLLAAVGLLFLIFAPLTARQEAGLPVTFVSDDGVSLHGNLHMPPGKKAAGFVVLAHGNRQQGSGHPFYTQLAHLLSQEFVVLTFDFRGFGASKRPPKDFASLDFSADIIAAVDFLASHYEIPPEDIALVGHSIGSLEVIHAGRLLGSRTVIALGPGDLDKIYLASPEGRQAYLEKIRNHSGIDINDRELDTAIQPILLPNLFGDCGARRLMVVYGEEETDAIANLQPFARDYQQRCQGTSDLSITTVAGMNHMYHSEPKAFVKKIANLVFQEHLDGITILARRLSYLLRRDRLETAASSGQIMVDVENPAWLRHKDGGPFFLAGPGDPEGFLYRGRLNPDGTRTGDQEDLIGRLAKTGANSIYLMAVRSHGGDARKDKESKGPANRQNPFVDGNPDKGLNDTLLNQWEEWFTTMDSAGITIFFIFYDDGAVIWNSGDKVERPEKKFLRHLVNRFEHHKHLIWCVAEEYDEEYSPARVREIARIIRKADDFRHPIAVHKRPGLDFNEFLDTPYIDQFAIQYTSKQRDTIHTDTVRAFRAAAGAYGLNGAEIPYGGIGTGAEARLKSWAIAMGGAYVMVNGMDIASTAESDMNDLGTLVRFFEQTDFPRMLPRDDLAAIGAEYVLANPDRSSYIAYTSRPELDLGISGIPAGPYSLLWCDAASGQMLREEKTVSGEEVRWPRPAGFGAEVALSLARRQH